MKLEERAMMIPTAAEIQAIRERDDDAGLNSDVQSERDRRTLLAALDAAQAENKVLRTCFCIADDETVVSSVEGSILIDSKGGTRRRYFTATDEERKLKEQLDAANDKLKRAQSTIRFTLASEVYDFDLVKGCEAICGSLHREEEAHSKTRQAMEPDKRHIREQIADKHRILGEYQTRLDAVTAERDKLRDAIRQAGFGVCQTSGDWTIHDTSDLGKREQEKTTEIIVENMELSIKNQSLKEQLDAVTVERDRLPANMRRA